MFFGTKIYLKVGFIVKKKAIRILIVTVSLLLCIGIFKTALIYLGNLYTKDYYGADEYKQIIYPTSVSDYFTAKKVLKEVDEALSTITDMESAEKKFGELGYFCVTDESAVRENHNLIFVAADFSEDTGYVWGQYTTLAYDKKGENTSGSWRILFKLELEKIGNEWRPIEIKEHP